MTLTDVSHIVKLVGPSHHIGFIHYTRKVAQNKGPRVDAWMYMLLLCL